MANEAGIQYLGDQGASGTVLGYTTTSLIGFYGATPVDKPAATEDIKDLLVAFGLMTDSGASPLNLDGGDLTASTATVTSLSVSGLASFASDIAITTSGDLTVDGITATDVTISNDLTISDEGNVILATTTGTKIGTATDQKLGFYNVTPVVQPTGASQEAITATGTANASSLTCTVIASLHSLATDCKTLVNALRTGLVATGVVKGEA